ncbi:putative flavin-containing monooxygenase 1 [Primulina tabacum]|uniref:putative flavin-containing monooxygenase 1 n=1 Tax=Primulina tabacum TaxID=48773 RepID=UPI003F59D707
MDSSITFQPAMKEKQIAIIGAGISGLLACKHTLEKGFNPIVFEAGDCIGGVWSRTVESTKLQCPKDHFQFSDFPWPNSVADMFPDYNQVMDYLQSYALHFNIIPQIKFNSKVISIDYILSSADEKMYRCWSMWGGTGEAFSPKGKWNVTVEDSMHPMDPYKVYQVDFVILCIGLFSGLPNIPDIPISKGVAGFKGLVLHSMDYAAMDKIEAAKLVEGKRVTVVGSRKSALDIATQIAKTNGATYPCTLLFRRVQWPGTEMLVRFIFRNLTRFSELMIHKPDEGLVICFLALVLSPLRRIFSILVECYLKWIYPLKKYDMVPDHTFLSQIYSCMFTMLPESFYNRVNERSLVLKKSPTFCFCENGFILENESDPLETDIVILGTGYKGDEKLLNIFSSTEFKKFIRGTLAPFYRECIHPRIPQLAIVGYSESPATIFSFEMRSKWIAHFLDGKFRLPSIQKMEDNVNKWEKNGRRYGGNNYRRECAGVLLPIHCNDEISMDIGANPKRKKWFFPEFFSPYHPFDYAGL